MNEIFFSPRYGIEVPKPEELSSLDYIIQKRKDFL